MKNMEDKRAMLSDESTMSHAKETYPLWVPCQTFLKSEIYSPELHRRFIQSPSAFLKNQLCDP